MTSFDLMVLTVCTRVADLLISDERSTLTASKRVYEAPCQLLCFSSESPDDCFRYLSIRMYSDGNNLATPRFNVWSSNEELTTALHYSVRAGTCYVICRRGQGSLNSEATIVVFNGCPSLRLPTTGARYLMFSILPT
jgi:hypothetical protein